MWECQGAWVRVFANCQRDGFGGVPTLAGLEDFGQLRSAFANVLAKRRLKKRWSQVDLAAYSGLEHSYISRLEKGLRTPSIEVTFRLAQAFQVTPERFLKEVRAEFESLKG